MKKLLSAFVLIAIVFSASYVASPADADARRDRTIEMTWCWGATEVHAHCPVQDVIRHGDGTLSTVWNGQTETGVWTYDRPTKTITMTFDNYPGLVYEGQKRRGCFTGTMTNTAVSQSGVWSGCLT